MAHRLTHAQHTATLAKVEKINARAAKRGFTGRVTLDAAPASWWVFVAEDGHELAESTADTAPTSVIENGPLGPETGAWVARDGYDVTVGGEAPCYDGWAFVATLDWDAAGCGELIVATAPGVEDAMIDRTRLVEDWCAHCKKTRTRKVTYLVRNIETGAEMQVGSNCIKDFLGHTARIAWLDMTRVGQDLEDDNWGATLDDSWNTMEVLTLAWACTRAWGFTRSNEPGATKDSILTLLGSRTGAVPGTLTELNRHLPEARARATEMRTWITDQMAGDSEYALNLKAAARGERCTPRTIGLLASAPSAMFRAQERDAQRADQPASQWIGTPHTPKTPVRAENKVTVTAEIISISWPTNYSGIGADTRYVLRTAAGEVLIWKTANSVLGDDRGVTVTLTGTVKAHEEWKGAKQTVLTRCKVLAAAAAPA